MSEAGQRLHVASAPRYSRPRMRKPRCWFYGDLADRFQGGRWPRVEQVICDRLLVLLAISR